MDWNRDGKLDKLELQVEMPMKPDEKIFSIDMFLFFDVKLHVSIRGKERKVYIIIKSKAIYSL